MEIAQLSYRYLPVRGGQEVYIRNLQRVLRQRGQHSTVYQPNWGERGEDVVLAPRLPLIGRLVPYLAHHLFNWAVRLFYNRQLQHSQVIIVHYAFFSPPVWNLAKKSIILSHGIEWNLPPRNHYDRFSQKIGRKSFDRFTIVANDTDYFRHFGLNVQPGQSHFEQIAPGKWFLPNCVDTQVFKKSQDLPGLKERKLILVPRQITRDRGIDLAIRAFHLFSQQQADYNLLVMGYLPGGERAYLAHCKALVSELGLEDKVEFSSPVPHQEMPAYYSSAQATLIPSLRREGTSLSALESMACGTVTVSTNVAGLQDLPTLQAEATPQDLARKLLQAIEKRDELSRQQSGIVREVFNLENWANAWMRVIQQVAAQSA